MMVILIYLTCENETEAKAIARQLLEESLIACANVYPQIHSLYKWEGKIAEASESVAILKTKKENYSRIKTRIKQLHRYSCPCIIAIPVEAVNEEYASWLELNT